MTADNCTPLVSTPLDYPLAMNAHFLDKKTIAELTARMYLDIGAVRFMQDKPFIFTSGWASPVYNDSRWLISFPDVRATMMDFAIPTIDRDIGRGKIDAVAGGETAGIPFAAWVADRLQSADAIRAQEAEGLRPRRADRGAVDPGPARAAGRGPRHRRPQQGQFRQGDPRRRRQMRRTAS